MPAAMAVPLRRALNLAYTAFFAAHVPLMFCVDFVGWYPPALTPAPLLALRAWYRETYNDRLFRDAPPAYFGFYALLEATWHTALSAWVVGTGALLHGEWSIRLQRLGAVGGCIFIALSFCVHDRLHVVSYSCLHVKLPQWLSLH